MGYSLISIIPRIVARLNDMDQDLFSDDVILPYAQDAGDELQLDLELNGILVLEKRSVNIKVPTGTTQLSIPAGGGPSLIPTDMLEPQNMEERLAGSTDQFVQMVPRAWEPNILPSDSLVYWVYREEDIFFVGCTQDREVRIKYLKRLINITSTNSLINVNNSQQFMIARTASLLAQYIGENPTRAEELNKDAGTSLIKLRGIGVKSKQRTRTRRRPYILVGRRNWA